MHESDLQAMFNITKKGGARSLDLKNHELTD